MLVIHTAESTARSAAEWFSVDHRPDNGPSSAHYIVDVDGLVTRCVGEGDTAFHAGNADVNACSIGIELEGHCDDGSEVFTPKMMRALLELADYLCERYGIARDRQHVIGHNEVPDARKGHEGQLGGAGHHHDPGPFYPWATFMAALAASAPIA
jgi:N-acetyl-anhydromuramyl-L-alanine amidase AmpD